MNAPAKNLMVGPWIWRLNRLRYPGWIIAPVDVRRRVSRNTERWVNPLAELDSTYTTWEKLFAFRELNWRLEITLLPLFTNVAEAVEVTLDGIDVTDVSGQTILIPAADASDVQADYTYSASEIEASWKELALALLRFKREERLFRQFDHWTERLSDTPSLTDDEWSHVCYEKALLAFAQMDDNAIVAAVESWPTSSSLFWQVRKSSVLAQIGRTDEATTLAEAALDRIQRSVHQPSQSQFLLTLEGWTLTLLTSIHSNVYRESPKQKMLREKFDRRMRQLERLKCEPWRDVENVTAFANLPQPEFLDKTEEFGFQPGEKRDVRYLGRDPFEKLKPAYEVMRFSEEAPFPSAIGNVLLCKNSLRAAGKWLIAHDSLRTDSLLLYTLDNKLTEAYLSRHRVAAMAEDRSRQLYTFARRAVEQALNSESAHDPLATTPEGLRAASRVSCGIEIMARLSIRLSFDELSGLWDFALALFRNNFVARCRTSDDAVKQLWRSLVECMPEHELRTRFESVVELPIPNTDGFVVWNELSWPCPVNEFARHVSALSDTASERWQPVASDLLRKAGSGNPRLKSRALSRLSVLEYYGCLDSQQREEFAEIYWSEVDNYDLPNVQGIKKTACLRWPSPKGVDVSERFKVFALDIPDGAGAAELNAKIRTWRQVTQVGPGRSNDRNVEIDWSNDDVQKMLDCVQSCWSDIKSSPDKSKFRLSFASITTEMSLEQQVEDILVALREVIVPRVVSSEQMESISKLVKEIEASDYSISVLLAVIHSINTAFDAERIARSGLASHERDGYLSTLMGILFWSEYAGKQLSGHRGLVVPDIPQQVVREIGTIVANRRQPYLDQALLTTAVYLRTTKQELDGHFVSSVLVGLRYLYAELGYRWSDEIEGSIRYEEVPSYRRYAVRVANHLYAIHKVSDETVIRWLESAERDVLPEVRREVTVSPSSSPEKIQFAGDVFVSAESLLKSLLRKRTRPADLHQVLEYLRSIEIDRIEGKEPDLKLAALAFSKIAKMMLKSRRAELFRLLTELYGVGDDYGNDIELELFEIAVNDDSSEPFKTLKWLDEFFSLNSGYDENVKQPHSFDA